MDVALLTPSRSLCSDLYKERSSEGVYNKYINKKAPFLFSLFPIPLYNLSFYVIHEIRMAQLPLNDKTLDTI